MGDRVLETERTVLRHVGHDDVADHNRFLNTPAVMEHLGGAMPIEDIEQRHAKVRAMVAKDGIGFLFMIEKASGEMIGYCGIKWVDNAHAQNQGDYEIGWIVREDRWRLGFAHEAICAIIDWGFYEIGAPQLVALTSKRNIGSWQLMEKLGMQRRRDLDFTDPAYPAKDSPTIQYSLTPTQWKAAK